MPRTKVSEQEEILLWRDRLDRAKARLKAEKGRWVRTLVGYRGIFDEEAPSDAEKRNGIHLLYATAARMIPRYYYREPNILVRPRPLRIGRDPALREGAKAMKAYLQTLFELLRIGKTSRKVLLDVILFNTGWVKVGYQARFQQKADKKVQIGADVPAFPPEMPMRLKHKALQEFNLKPSDISYQHNRVADELFVNRVYPWYVLMDPDASEPEEAAWIAQIIPKRPYELEDSDLYKKDLVEMLEATITEEEMFGGDENLVSGEMPGLTQDDMGWHWLYEIWDRREGRLLVMGEQGEEWLRNQDWPYDMDGFPFKRLQFNFDPKKAIGQPDAEMWLPIVEELNEYRNKRRARVRKNISKWIALADLFGDDAVRQKIESDVDGDIALLEGQDMASTNLRNVIMRLDPAQTPQDLGIAEARAMENISNISGISEQRRGVSGTYLTATEASIIEVNARDMEGDRLSQVAEWQADIALALLSLARQYKTATDIVHLTGAPGVGWYEVSPELRKRPFDVKVQVGSSRFEDPNERAQKIMTFLQISVPFGITDIEYLLRELAIELGLPEDVVINPADPQGVARLLLVASARSVMGIEAPGGNGGPAPGGGVGAMAAGGSVAAPRPPGMAAGVRGAEAVPRAVTSPETM